MASVCVTGGAGFIGSAIMARLRKRGEAAIALDNFSRGFPKDKHCYYLDVRDLQATREAMVGASEVIHAAFINGTKTFYERPDEVLEVGVKGIVNVIDACKANNIKRLTLISSSEVCRAQLVMPNEAIPLVIPDPYNPRYSYSAGKIISEMLALHSRQFDHLLIARPFNIYGPGMSAGHVIPDFIAQLDGDPFRILGNGNETRSFCYIDDFIDAFMLMRDKGQHRGIYNIGTEEEITIRQLAETLIRLSGQKKRIVESGELREGDASRRRPDTKKIRELGFIPKIKLADGLKACAAATHTLSLVSSY
jgi:nucleoside-diphosphate-sugar epimerase